MAGSRPGGDRRVPGSWSSACLVACLATCLTTLAACRPPAIADIYPGMQTGDIVLDGGFHNRYYLFERGADNDVLVVLLDGSGYESVLGRFDGDRVVRQGLPSLMLEKLPGDMNLLVVEKPNVEPGQDATGDPSVLAVYSLANRSAGCDAIVEQGLAQRPYGRVVFLGYSEGGWVAPHALRRLGSAAQVTRMILAASGGYSLYENYKIKYATLPDKLAELEQAKAAIDANPLSTQDTWMGHTYLRWSGLFNYAPIVDLLEEHLPILLVHGSADRSVPVDSSRSAYQTLLDAGRTDVRYIETTDDHHGIFNVSGPMVDWIRGG